MIHANGNQVRMAGDADMIVNELCNAAYYITQALAGNKARGLTELDVVGTLSGRLVDAILQAAQELQETENKENEVKNDANENEQQKREEADASED